MKRDKLLNRLCEFGQMSFSRYLIMERLGLGDLFFFSFPAISG